MGRAVRDIRVQWVQNLGTRAVYLSEHALLIVDAALSREQLAEVALDVLAACRREDDLSRTDPQETSDGLNLIDGEGRLPA